MVSKVKPADMGYEETLAAAAGTLGRLRMKYLDLYLIHAPGGSRCVFFCSPPRTLSTRLIQRLFPVRAKRQATWRAMEELKRRGVCRAIGVSNYEPRHLQELLSAAEVPPAVNQVEYHPAQQQRELAGFCAGHGAAFPACYPCITPVPVLALTTRCGPAQASH